MGGSGFGKASVTPSPSSASLVASRVTVPPEVPAFQPVAVLTAPSTSECGPPGVAVADGSGRAPSSSPVMASGPLVTPTNQWARPPDGTAPPAEPLSGAPRTARP